MGEGLSQGAACEQLNIHHTMYAVIPILFLDLYRAHMMTSIVEQITALGVEVEHIPGGCTLCQPIDIGVNKPFKHQIHQQWEQWIIDIVAGLQGEPRRVLHQGRTLSNEIIINSWRHGEDTWFPAN